jgi:ATP-dependent DNA ligase
MRCRLRAVPPTCLLYYAFDLLYLDGYDLRRCALEDRKATLTARLVGAPSRIHYSEHHAGDGPAFFKSVGQRRTSLRCDLATKRSPAGL